MALSQRSPYPNLVEKVTMKTATVRCTKCPWSREEVPFKAWDKTREEHAWGVTSCGCTPDDVVVS